MEGSLTSCLPGSVRCPCCGLKLRECGLWTVGPLQVGGDAFSGVAATRRHRRSNSFVQRASAPGRYLLVGRLLQQRMAEPEPLILPAQQARRHQVIRPALWDDRCQELGIDFKTSHCGSVQQSLSCLVEAFRSLPHRGSHDVRNQQQLT